MAYTFDNRPPSPALPRRCFLGNGEGIFGVALLTEDGGSVYEFTAPFRGRCVLRLAPGTGTIVADIDQDQAVPTSLWPTTVADAGDTVKFILSSSSYEGDPVSDFADFVEDFTDHSATDTAPVAVIPADPPPAWAACRVASTGNVDLSNGLEAGDTVDGVTLAAGDRVLVRAQSTASQNGIYAAVASGAASRATDANESAEFVTGRVVFVREGSSLAGTYHGYTAATRPTLGSTSLTFAQVPPPAAMTP